MDGIGIGVGRKTGQAGLGWGAACLRGRTGAAAPFAGGGLGRDEWVGGKGEKIWNLEKGRSENALVAPAGGQLHSAKDGRWGGYWVGMVGGGGSATQWATGP